MISAALPLQGKGPDPAVRRRKRLAVFQSQDVVGAGEDGQDVVGAVLGF